MERREELHRLGCSIAKQTILTSHPSGLRTRVSVELASMDSVCIHHLECKGSPLKILQNRQKESWDLGSPFFTRRGVAGGLSAHGTPVLGRRSDIVTEGRLSQQCTPVMRRKDLMDSAAASPLLSRRLVSGEVLEEDLSDVDNSVISGWLKFRDNKRWKSRWGVITKLSPAADCLHLQLYRDPKDRFKKGQSKASLSLQHFLGFESGFTLDKESHTIAVICQDVIVVLAFETRERLIAWQVKLSGVLGSSRQFVVLVAGSGSKRLPAGPARLHVRGERCAITAAVPPRLLGLWELKHLRRYGVVDGRFCFEGGSRCGRGEGLHVLLTDDAQEITDTFNLAASGQLTDEKRSAGSRKSIGGEKGNNSIRPDTRLSDFNTDSFDINADSASAIYEENFFGEDRGTISPFWPSNETQDLRDIESIHGNDLNYPWEEPDQVTLERCTNCCEKLGASSRSSTVAVSPGVTNFSPTWTMEAIPDLSVGIKQEYVSPRVVKNNVEACCDLKPPRRPPKPLSKKPAAQLPMDSCFCDNTADVKLENPKAGPYENYDFPKPIQAEVANNEYYDTPKRIKEAISDDLFRVAKNNDQSLLVLKKNCGCILKFGSKKTPIIVDCEENLQPVDCPCQKITSWANTLINLPYCKKNVDAGVSNKETEQTAIYATVDVSRKTNRQSSITVNEKESSSNINAHEEPINYENIIRKDTEMAEGPYSNYENLNFALSLEYYENAKDLLKKAGVTQNELDALSANLNQNSSKHKQKLCSKCSDLPLNNQKKHDNGKLNKNDEYLLMEPPSCDSIKGTPCNRKLSNPGYTSMTPVPNWSQSLKYPSYKDSEVAKEKSLSIPALNYSQNTQNRNEINKSKISILQKRSSSVDSAPILEDLKEFDSSIGSHATSSSLETLRNMALENRRPSVESRECCDNDYCEKSTSSDQKTSDADCSSASKEIPNYRNKLIDNEQIKRSSSVPCKSAGNRDSSSSNDSGVSSCSLKQGAQESNEYELPLTTGNSKYHYMLHRRVRGNQTGCLHSSLPRKSKSSDPLRDLSLQLQKAPSKSSSAEAEVPILPPKHLKGVIDTHSTSSGTSDMSDYIETLSMSSSQSSDTQTVGMRMLRQPTNTLRPRSGKEYHNLDPALTHTYKHNTRDGYTHLS